MTTGDTTATNSAIALLADAAMELMHCQTSGEVYTTLATFMSRFVPEAVVIVNEHVPGSDHVTCREIVGTEDSRLASARELLGFDPIGRTFALTDLVRSQLVDVHVSRVLGGLAELASGEIPRAAGGAIASAFEIGDVCALGITDGTTSYGNVTFLTKMRHPRLPLHEIDSLARHGYTTLAHLADQLELREREQSNRLLLDSMVEGLSLQEIILDSRGRPVDALVLTANPAMELMTNRSVDEMVGQTLHGLLPHLHQSVIESMGRVALEGISLQLPRQTTPAGRLLDSLAYSPGPGKFALLVSDVTERAHAEVELRESERWLNESQRVAELGHYLYDIVNDRWEGSESLYEVLGADGSRRLGLAEWLEVVHPDERDRVARYFAQDVLGARAPFDLEYRIQRPSDGAERWVHGLGKVEYAPDGTPLVMFGVIQDITRRRLAEDQHRAIIQTAMDGFYLSDIEGRLHEVNQAYCQMTGYSEAELLGMCIADLELNESPEAIDARTEGIIARGEDRFETRHRRKDGTTFEVDVRVRYQPGDAPKLASFLRDITDRKRAEAELHENQARLTELLAEREQNLELLEGSLASLIEVVSNVVEIRDPYTAGHQHRVAELAVAIAEELGMPRADVEQIRLASLIHDVGKMSVPAEILSKPGRLMAVEFELIKGHAESGYRIIESAQMSGDIAQMVYQHHERCDGSGYPRGLIGEELLPGSKVIAVADVVEAMTSHRPYRASLGHEAALAEVVQGSGSLYDPDVVTACVACFRERDFAFSPT